LALPDGERCAANQVLYNLNCRGIEWDLLPLCLAHGIAIMAYSPIGQGKLLHSRALASIARRSGVTAAQLALAWLLTRAGVAAIPKATETAHVHDNRLAVELMLTAEIVTELERAFPPPRGRTPLAIL
jgi:diketogulonate reductase-like aldo/keto reductase